MNINTSRALGKTRQSQMIVGGKRVRVETIGVTINSKKERAESGRNPWLKAHISSCGMVAAGGPKCKCG